MFKAYWEKKSERDKVILSVVLSFILITLLFGGIWLPMHIKKNDLQEELRDQQQILALMHKQVPLLKELRGSNKRTTTKDIFSLVETKFKNLTTLDPKLTIEKLTENKVSIQFSEIPFDELIKQLVLLNKEYRIGVEEFDVMRIEKQGMVSGKVVLSI
jgi:type II secretory pathway component PulM